MDIIKIKTDSIAQLSYLLISNDEAAVIDPRRDAKIYMQKASKKGAKIKYIFETHRNEDYVTGSRELRRFTKAPIYHGKGLDFEFGNDAEDGQKFELGDLTLKVLATPGHTPESISIAVFPESDCGSAVGVFTGDALFVNDVGRTDFFKDEMEKYAGLLYDSIHDKILPLGEQTVLYPAHGSGSVCGGGIADREVSTLGYEMKNNPMLQLERQQFVKKKVNEKHQMPAYFKKMEEVNLKGNDQPFQNYLTLDLLSPKQFKEKMKDVHVVDVRGAEAYIGCFIKGSLSIPKDMLGAYAGYFLSYDKEIFLVGDSVEQCKEANHELRRLGYDNVKAVLNGGISKWETAAQPIDSIHLISVNEIDKICKDDNYTLVDVRKPDEWEDGIIDGARAMFLGDLQDNISEFDKGQKIVTYCGSGKRATIAASIFKRNGFENVSSFMGSMKAYRENNG